MKIGRTLQELAQEIEHQREAKHDYVASTRNLHMSLREENNHCIPQLAIGDEMSFDIKQHAHEQIAAHVGIPNSY